MDWTTKGEGCEAFEYTLVNFWEICLRLTGELVGCKGDGLEVSRIQEGKPV